jgi:hypothetical protein
VVVVPFDVVTMASFRIAKTFLLYITENTLRLHYKYRSLEAVLVDVTSFRCGDQTIRKYCGWQNAGFLVSQQVLHIVTTVL